MDFNKIVQKVIDFLKNVDMSKLSGVAALVFIVGLVILSFTFIIPLLAVLAAIGIIAFAVYLVYKFIGGK
jgi:hypothetical protein